MTEQNEPAKSVSASRTEQIQIIMPQHINGDDRLFGGQLVAWIDVVATVVGRRHSGHAVTTVSIDNLHFKAGAKVNSVIVLIGQVTYVGQTSMEVRVDTFVERLQGEKSMVNRAYLTLVALDERECPVRVPRLRPETDAERAEYDAGHRRAELRRKQRAEPV